MINLRKQNIMTIKVMLSIFQLNKCKQKQLRKKITERSQGLRPPPNEILRVIKNFHDNRVKSNIGRTVFFSINLQIGVLFYRILNSES